LEMHLNDGISINRVHAVEDAVVQQRC
jgi:hypothetical protein